MTTQAIATRDAMAKALYGALFDWIVDQVSSSMDGEFPMGYVLALIMCKGITM